MIMWAQIVSDDHFRWVIHLRLSINWLTVFILVFTSPNKFNSQLALIYEKKKLSPADHVWMALPKNLSQTYIQNHDLCKMDTTWIHLK